MCEFLSHIKFNCICCLNGNEGSANFITNTARAHACAHTQADIFKTGCSVVWRATQRWFWTGFQALRRYSCRHHQAMNDMHGEKSWRECLAVPFRGSTYSNNIVSGSLSSACNIKVRGLIPGEHKHTVNCMFWVICMKASAKCMNANTPDCCECARYISPLLYPLSTTSKAELIIDMLKMLKMRRSLQTWRTQLLKMLVYSECAHKPTTAQMPVTCWSGFLYHFPTGQARKTLRRLLMHHKLRDPLSSGQRLNFLGVLMSSLSWVRWFLARPRGASRNAPLEVRNRAKTTPGSETVSETHRGTICVRTATAGAEGAFLSTSLSLKLFKSHNVIAINFAT